MHSISHTGYFWEKWDNFRKSAFTLEILKRFDPSATYQNRRR
jgi:hypothetical protein